MHLILTILMFDDVIVVIVVIVVTVFVFVRVVVICLLVGRGDDSVRALVVFDLVLRC